MGLPGHATEVRVENAACFNTGSMTRILLALLLLAALPSEAGDPARGAAAEEQHPGYGVVEAITPLPRKAAPSASAGASKPGRREAATWLVRVRMDDGTLQVREMKKRSVAVGSRVLLTNAGDVLPD